MQEICVDLHCISVALGDSETSQISILPPVEKPFFSLMTPPSILGAAFLQVTTLAGEKAPPLCSCYCHTGDLLESPHPPFWGLPREFYSEHVITASLLLRTDGFESLLIQKFVFHHLNIFFFSR